MSSDESETKIRILNETWRMMERNRGQGVRLEDVARAAGISRQAVYLHFHSRAALLIATARYVDQIHGIDERLADFRQAKGGRETLHAYVDFWGNYIPEVYGLAKALLAARERDKAAAAAWDDRMNAMHNGCRCVIECLERELLLAPWWTITEAVDMMWGMLSVTLWENLTIERGWSQRQYIDRMQVALQHALEKPSG
jgi:AcrR family transcriptional regulator